MNKLLRQNVTISRTNLEKKRNKKDSPKKLCITSLLSGFYEMKW